MEKIKLEEAELWTENSLVVENDGTILTDEEVMEGDIYNEDQE